MTILWAGGEDISFPNGSMPSANVTGGRFRSDWARCGLNQTWPNVTNDGRSNPFPGGAITSCWFSFQVYTSGDHAPLRYAGLGKSGTAKALWIGHASAGKVRLSKFDGSSSTTLEDEAGTSLSPEGIFKIDVQVTSFADTVNGNVKVYVDGTEVIDYTGDLTLSGFTEIDCVTVQGTEDYSAGVVSELFVSTADTRNQNMKTGFLSAAGDLNQWDGAYTDIDEISNSDADIIHTDTIDEDFQANLDNLPAGDWNVLAVMEAARITLVAGSGVDAIAIGIKTGGTVNAGVDQSLLAGAWFTKERLMTVNPVTTNPFSEGEVDALQLNLRSR